MSSTTVYGVIASFVLHVVWQVPLLTGAAACAVRIGRPQPRVAHMIWLLTLALCVGLPVAATVTACAAAHRAQQDRTATITFGPAADVPGLMPLQRAPAWQRLLQRHASLRSGVSPFAFAVPRWWERAVTLAYLLLSGMFLVRLCVAWRRMRRILERSEACTLTDVVIGVQYTAARNLLSPPEVRISRDVAGPALAGVLRPVLLLPLGAETLSAGELQAMLAHEVAHLQRHDPVLHAICAAWLLPVAFHPCAWWAAQRIRQTREMACDAEAARCVGSQHAYARALLAIAERAGQVPDRGIGFFSNGLFGVGLELWNGQGTMEERMQMLMKSNGVETRGSRAVRMGTCVSLAGAAILVAAMVQVQPALAGERAANGQAAAATAPILGSASSADAGPDLLGGEHAQAQLRQARKDLLEAERNASTDEQRRTIATARAVTAAGERALADAGSSRGHRLDAMTVPDVHVDLSGLQADASKVRAQMEQARQSMEQVQTTLKSPEWAAQMRQSQAAAEKASAAMNSPELRAKIEAASRVDHAAIAALVANARRQQEQAMEQMRSGTIQRQIDEAAKLVARNDVPFLPGTLSPAEALKVPSDVMSSNAVQKVMPVYPPEAKEKKLQGEVLLHAIINEQGKVEQLAVVHSPGESFSKSALTAVQQWVYKPFLVDGKPVAVDTTITVHYSLAE